uniref:Uncharacterized protein n=1 Tax=Anguilla anguilla TaxID=7936 RepID=A0A0E9WVM5_ANGAN
MSPPITTGFVVFAFTNIPCDWWGSSPGSVWKAVATECSVVTTPPSRPYPVIPVDRHSLHFPFYSQPGKPGLWLHL